MITHQKVADLLEKYKLAKTRAAKHTDVFKSVSSEKAGQLASEAVLEEVIADMEELLS